MAVSKNNITREEKKALVGSVFVDIFTTIVKKKFNEAYFVINTIVIDLYMFVVVICENVCKNFPKGFFVP